MKKQYETPKAEKLEFDYLESVLACCSRYPNCEHQKSGSSEIYSNDPHGQFYKCTCQPKTSYQSHGWGENC